jgi:hypothetical protein
MFQINGTMRFYAKVAITFTTCFLIAGLIHAQIKKPGVTLGGYAIFSKPQTSFANFYDFGGGAEIFGGVGWGNTFIIGTAGFSAFKAASSSYGTLSYVPLKLGVKQFFLKKHLFINSDVGMASVKNKVLNESRFTRGIGAGAKLLGVEAGLYYDGWKNHNAKGFSNMLNVKLGWSISL